MCSDFARHQQEVQSNLCTTATLGTPKKWPLFRGGRCLEVAAIQKVTYKNVENGFKKPFSLSPLITS
jgi:hypothetical protein